MIEIEFIFFLLIVVAYIGMGVALVSVALRTYWKKPPQPNDYKIAIALWPLFGALSFWWGAVALAKLLGGIIVPSKNSDPKPSAGVEDDVNWTPPPDLRN